MEFIDYYKVLEIDRHANEEQIKKAYRKLARKYHPDLNPNDPESKKKFQMVNEANEVLSDPEKRKKYDQYGQNWQQADAFSRSGNSASGSSQQQSYQGSFGDEGDFSDFFDSLFGNRTGSFGSRKSVKFKGQDYQTELVLNLKDVFSPGKQTFDVNGKSIRIAIPPGVDDGQTIRIKGYGGEGANGGPNGDLYITFRMNKDSEYLRKGADLYKDVELDVYKALLGGELILETISGKIKVQVKSVTQNGTTIKLKGKGLPVYKEEGRFGDLYITFKVKLPKELSQKEREIITQLASASHHG